MHLNLCLWDLTNLSANVSWPDKERDWLMPAVEMDTFILISPGGISEGTRPEGPGKTPPGKAITASPASHHACHPLAGKERAPPLSSHVCWAAWSLDLRHAHTRIHSEGRKEGRKGERGGKGLLDILQCRPAVMELPHPLCGGSGGWATASLLRFLLVQTQTHSATAAVESMDSWSTARPPAPALPRPATLGSHPLRRGEGINGFVSRSSIIPHPISLEPSNKARHSAGLALNYCTLLHHSVALLSSLGCLSYKPI